MSPHLDINIVSPYFPLHGSDFSLCDVARAASLTAVTNVSLRPGLFSSVCSWFNVQQRIVPVSLHMHKHTYVLVCASVLRGFVLCKNKKKDVALITSFCKPPLFKINICNKTWGGVHHLWSNK